MMGEDFRQRAVFRSRGHLYEDFEVGQEFVHHWGRTITESDTVLFSTMLLHFNPLYFNREYAKAEGHPDIVLSKSDGAREDAGLVEFRHYGVNQRDEVVAQVDRRALIKRRSHWNK